MKSGKKFRELHPRFTKAYNRGNVVKITTKMKATIRKKNDPVFARRFVTIGVLVSVVMVGVSVFIAVYFNPRKVAERKFEELATRYYEEYYYERFMEGIEPEVFEEKMKTYEQTGLQPVLLRQLLLYQNGKYVSYKGYFEKDGFSCDKNKTSAKFYPVEPYGAKDYTVKYEYHCAFE